MQFPTVKDIADNKKTNAVSVREMVFVFLFHRLSEKEKAPAVSQSPRRSYIWKRHFGYARLDSADR